MSSDDLNRVMMDLKMRLDMVFDDICHCPVCGSHWIIISDGVGKCNKVDCCARWNYIIEVTDYGKMRQVHKPGRDEEKEVNRFELMEF